MAPRGTRGQENRVRTLFRILISLERRDQPVPCRVGRPLPVSGLLLVLDVPNDVGDVVVALLLLLDEGGVVQGLVLELDLVLGPLDRLAIRRLFALGLRV